MTNDGSCAWYWDGISCVSVDGLEIERPGDVLFLRSGKKGIVVQGVFGDRKRIKVHGHFSEPASEDWSFSVVDKNHGTRPMDYVVFCGDVSFQSGNQKS